MLPCGRKRGKEESLSTAAEGEGRIEEHTEGEGKGEGIVSRPPSTGEKGKVTLCVRLSVGKGGKKAVLGTEKKTKASRIRAVRWWHATKKRGGEKHSSTSLDFKGGGETKK